MFGAREGNSRKGKNGRSIKIEFCEEETLKKAG